MKPMPLFSFENSAKPGLQNAVDKLITPLVAVAVRNNSFIVNDVPSYFKIENDETTVTSVIDGILRSVIHNTRESCIRISAQVLYGNVIVVSVKDSNSFNTYAVACSLQDVVPLAQKIGGELDIMNQKQKVTTISFRFPIEQAKQNSPVAVD